MALDFRIRQLATMREIIGTATMSALALFAMPAFAGKLGRASDAARSSSSSSDSSTTSSESTVNGSPSNASDDVVGPALLYVIASPWLVPHVVVEDGRPDGAAVRVRFAAYPYAEPSAGLLVEGPPPPRPPQPVDQDVAPDSEEADTASATSPAVAGATTSKWAALELGLEEGIGVDEGVIRSGFHARAQFPFRLGLDTSWSLYREGQGERVERLGLGREHLDFRFAESSRVHFQTGIGPQHLVDSQGWVNGVDVTWGFQAFPANPLVLAAEGSLGSLGSAFAPGFRGEIGLMLNRVEVSAGYEERWVGPVGLGGPFVSLTLWL